MVASRFFEDAYQERYTAATILATLGVGAARDAGDRDDRPSDAVSDDQRRGCGARRSADDRGRGHAASGDAPLRAGKHDYQVVQLTIDPQPWLRAHDTVYPASEIYHFKPLDERVEVYSKPFRLQRDFSFLATPEAQKLLGGMPSVTITGALEYQACDDKVCFNPMPSAAPFHRDVETARPDAVRGVRGSGTCTWFRARSPTDHAELDCGILRVRELGFRHRKVLRCPRSFSWRTAA